MSLPNADAVVRPSTVEKIVKVPPGVKDIGFGVAPRIPTTTVNTTIITENEGMVLERSETVGHPR